MSKQKQPKRMQHKPTQKVVKFSFKGNNLRAHDLALVPYRIWYQFRVQKTMPNYAMLDVSYRPTLKVVRIGEKEYTFFNNFYHIESILTSEGITEQPCLVYQGSSADIELAAWKDVFDLAFQRSINHASLYHQLHKALDTIPQSTTILNTFLKSSVLTIDAYCHFAEINQSTFYYDKGVATHLEVEMKKNHEKKRLPKNEDWLSERH